VLSLANLEAQAIAYLKSLTVTPELHSWLSTQTERSVGEQAELQERAVESIDKAIIQAQAELSTVTGLRIRGLLDDAEFMKEREGIQRRIIRLQESRAEVATQQDWFEPFETLVSFSSRAAECFQHGNDRIKRLILEIVGSNLTLMDRTLNIEAADPFRELVVTSDILGMRAFRDDIRTRHNRHDSDLSDRVAKIRLVEEEIKRIEDERTTGPPSSPESLRPPDHSSGSFLDSAA